MMRHLRTATLCALAAMGLALGANVAGAAAVLTGVTYVDANSGNTGAAADITFASNVDTDNKWGERLSANFGFAGSIFESLNSKSPIEEDSPEITTTISGLTPFAEYEITGYYQSQAGSAGANWEVNMGLASGVYTHFDNGDNLLAIGDTAFTNALTVQGAASATKPRNEYWGVIGNAFADASGEIVVYINDDDNLATDLSADRQRTWYDGVGYALAVPEPGSLVLLGLGSLMMVFRRRR